MARDAAGFIWFESAARQHTEVNADTVQAGQKN
jgi:hypothetical protein